MNERRRGHVRGDRRRDRAVAVSRIWLVVGYAVLAAIGFLVGSYVVERLFW